MLSIKSDTVNKHVGRPVLRLPIKCWKEGIATNIKWVAKSYLELSSEITRVEGAQVSGWVTNGAGEKEERLSGRPQPLPTWEKAATIAAIKEPHRTAASPPNKYN